MKNIETVLENEYRTALLTCGFSDKRKLYKLYESPKHTSVSRKIIISYAVLIAAILILALTGAAAAYTLRDAVDFRTKDLGITDEKRDEMAENLEEWGMTPEEVVSGKSEIGVNENGDTYGYAFDGVDLISVGGHDSTGDVTGYVYRDDFDFLNMDISNNVSDIEGIVQEQKDREDGKVRNWIYVYDSDGYTVLGKYIQEYDYSESVIYGRDQMTQEEYDRILEERFYARQERLGDFEYGFNTNEELENPEYEKFIIDGADSEEYINMAKERSEEIEKHVTDSAGEGDEQK